MIPPRARSPSLGPCLEHDAEPAHASLSQPMRFLAPLALSTAAAAHLRNRCDWRQATYPHTGTAVAFIISELPGERAEALFIAMAALVPTAGKQSANPD